MKLTPLRQRPITAIRRPGQLITPSFPRLGPAVAASTITLGTGAAEDSPGVYTLTGPAAEIYLEWAGLPAGQAYRYSYNYANSGTLTEVEPVTYADPAWTDTATDLGEYDMQAYGSAVSGLCHTNDDGLIRISVLNANEAEPDMVLTIFNLELRPFYIQPRPEA